MCKFSSPDGQRQEFLYNFGACNRYCIFYTGTIISCRIIRYYTAKGGDKKNRAILLIPAAISYFVTGVSEAVVLSEIALTCNIGSANLSTIMSFIFVVKLACILVFIIPFAILLSNNLAFIGALVRHIVISRVPITLLIIYLTMVRVSYDDSLPTIVNLFTTRSYPALAIAGFCATFSVGVMVFCLFHVWRLAEKRCGLYHQDPFPTRFYNSQFLPSPVLVIISVAAWRLIDPFSNSDPEVGSDWLMRSFVMLTGIVAGVGLISLSRKLSSVLDKPGKVNDFLERIAISAGPGYWDDENGKIHEGHKLSLSIAILFVTLYVFGFYFLNPENQSYRVPILTWYHLYLPSLLFYVIWLLVLLSFLIDFASL